MTGLVGLAAFLWKDMSAGLGAVSTRNLTVYNSSLLFRFRIEVFQVLIAVLQKEEIESFLPGFPTSRQPSQKKLPTHSRAATGQSPYLRRRATESGDSAGYHDRSPFLTLQVERSPQA